MSSKKKSNTFSHAGKHSAEAKNKELKKLEKEEKKKQRLEEKERAKEEKKIEKENKKKDNNKEKNDSSIVINMQEIDREKLEKKIREKKTEEKQKKKYEKIEAKEKRKETKKQLSEQKKEDTKSNKKEKESDEESNISYFERFKTKKINKKRLILLIVGSIILIAVISIFAAYLTIDDFRDYVDTNILRKVKTTENLYSIEINNDDKYTNKYKDNNKIFAYNDKVCVLKNNVLTIYNSQANKIKELEMEVTNPIVETYGDIIAIAEEYGNKIYLVSAKNILWEKQIEGQISRININKNGYVSIVVTGTSYKSVIYLFDSTGEEVFKYYISNTMVLDTDVSEDNKYLAYAEVDSSGALIQSNIKILSIEKIRNNDKDPTIYVHEAAADKLITQIKYQDSRLVCMYNDSIEVIKGNSENTELISFNKVDGRCIYADINLNNKAVLVIEKELEDGKSQTVVNLYDTLTKYEKVYVIDGSAKGLVCNDRDKFVVNVGSELYIINLNGFLVKKYVSERDIPHVIISEGIIGIIYNNKVELMNI